MSKKYYWRTSLAMAPIVLENGFIASDDVYQRILGREIMVNIYDRDGSGFIVLYSHPPSHQNVNEDGPVIFTIDETVLDKKYLVNCNDCVKHRYPLPIFILPETTEILTVSDAILSRLQSRMSGSEVIKWADCYTMKNLPRGEKQIVYQEAQPQGLGFTEENPPIPLEELCHKMRLSDTLSGAFVALIIGYLCEQTAEQRAFSLSLKKVRNEFSGFITDSDLVSGNGPRKVMLNYKERPKYKELLQALEELLRNVDEIQPDGKKLADMSKQCIELQQECDKCSKHMLKTCKESFLFSPDWPSASWRLLGYFKSDPFQWRYGTCPIILSLIKMLYNKSDSEWEENIHKIEKDIMKEPLFIVYTLWDLVVNRQSLNSIVTDFKRGLDLLNRFVVEQCNARRDISSIQSLLNDLYVAQDTDRSKEHFTLSSLSMQQNIPDDYRLWQIILRYLWQVAEYRTKNDIKGNGWQYSQRIEFVNNIRTAVNSLTNQQYNHDLDLILHSLDSEFEAMVKIDDLGTLVLRNLYAFLYQYDDPEKMNDYLVKNNVSHVYFAWSFWGGLYGLSALPKRYTDPIAEVLHKSDVRKIYRKIEDLRKYVWAARDTVTD